MADVGVEVGQKMRLAIKAKLTELNCYVDDELPDYIMVMIANKRTKSQMKDDLNLFLANETSFFVEWLHIVLKKLKQVHVTNPNVFKNPIKRKSNEYLITQEDYKKVKKEESKVKKEKVEGARSQAAENSPSCEEQVKSLTDDLPITANRLSEAGRRKIVLVHEPIIINRSTGEGFTQGLEDDFDIPLLSEINASNEEELEQLERRIKNVKSRLGLQVESDKEEDDEAEVEEEDDDDAKDCLSIKPDPGEMEFSEQLSKSPPTRRIITSQRTIKRAESSKPRSDSPDKRDDSLARLERQLEMKRSIHARIVFDKEKDSLKAKYDSIMKRTANRQNRLEISENAKVPENIETKKRSILDRLGKRPEKEENKAKAVRSENHQQSTIQSKVIRPQKERRSDKKVVSSIMSRVGVLSKVSIPQKKHGNNVEEKEKEKRSLEVEDDHKLGAKNVASVVKVKPRVLPEKAKQANPNLLFKAVAEAQRSVSQTPTIGNNKQNERQAEIKKTTSAMKNNHEQQKEKSPAPALFTKKYKLQMAAAAAKKSDELLANLDAKRSIIINRNRKAKLLDDEKLKLRFLLTQTNKPAKESKTITKDFIETKSNNSDDDDSSSVKSDVSSRTPELPRKQIDKDLKEKEIFLKSKITIENKVDESVHIKLNDDDDDSTDEHDEQPSKHKFIVTLDGIDKLKLNFAHIDNDNSATVGNGIKYPEISQNQDIEPTKDLKTKRSPSPIIFDAPKPVVAVAPTKTSVKKPDVPNIQHVPVAKKTKEKCKYFPNCRQGDRCEFMHPGMCKMFPNCKFAEVCIYTHPMCKFEMSCTRKNCPYSHSTSKTSAVTSSQSVCKYFPNCSNNHCPYYHPKYGTMCKYGMHCKNAACVFQHPSASGHQNGGKLTWRLVK